MGIVSGDPVEVVIPPFSFSSRFLVDEATRIYVPAAFAAVVPREFWAHVGRHGGSWIVARMGQTRLDLFDLDALGMMDGVPRCGSPRYGRGMGYCGRCASAFPLAVFGRCPYCGSALRTRPR